MTDLNELNNLLTTFRGYIILFFTAEYCKPCKQLKPIFIEYMNNKSSNIIYKIIEMENSPDIGIEYKITKIPLLRLYNNAQLIDEYVGTDKGKFKSLLEKYK